MACDTAAEDAARERELSRRFVRVNQSTEHGTKGLAHAAALLGHSRVTIRPVIDLADQRPIDAYEFTGTLREAVFLARPADVFPYAVNTSRAVQIDHTEPFRPDGPPGQTSLANGGPMTAHHHRIATHGRWRRRQPVPGRVAWATPHGRYRVTDPTGTHLLDPVLGSLLFDGSAMEQRMIGTVLSAPP